MNRGEPRLRERVIDVVLHFNPKQPSGFLTVMRRVRRQGPAPARDVKEVLEDLQKRGWVRKREDNCYELNDALKTDH